MHTVVDLELDASGVPPLAKRADAVQASFVGPCEPPRTSFGYRLGILLATVFVLLLPCCYVGVIVLIGWGMVWHAIHDAWLVFADGRNFAKSVLYLAPLIAGTIVIAFLIKPLIPKKRRGESRLLISPDQEPVLEALLTELCRRLQAPFPHRIALDERVNASASFGESLWSSLWGRQLVLTIGMPLVGGMTVRELAGVLAHELGHFRQGGGHRLSRVIHAVLGWFHRAIYERDQWDEELEERSKRGDVRLAAALWLARGAIWLSRRILFALYWIGLVVASFLLRQREFDADQCQVRIAGTDAFSRIMTKLVVLSGGAEVAYQHLRDCIQHGRLFDNLPAAIVHCARKLDRADARHRLENVLAGRTHRFDTHPSESDRIAAARAAGQPGVLECEWPAAALFQNEAATSRQVTRWWYAARGFSPEQLQRGLCDTQQLLRYVDAVQRSLGALERVTQKLLVETMWLPLPLEPLHSVAERDLEQCATQARLAREQFLGSLTDARNVRQAHRAVRQRYQQGYLHSLYRELGVPFGKPSPFSMDELTRELDQSDGELRTAVRPLARRIEAGLELWRCSQLEGKLPERRQQWERIMHLYELAKQLHQKSPMLWELQCESSGLEGLLDVLRTARMTDDLANRTRLAAQQLLERLRARLEAVIEDLAEYEYVTELDPRVVPVAEMAFGRLPEQPVEPEEWISLSQQGVQQFFRILARIYGELCECIEQAEEAAGLCYPGA